MKLLWILGFGLLGVVVRFLLVQWAQRGGTLSSPQMIFGINVLGSFLIGGVFAAGSLKSWLSPEWSLILSVGFLGAFTTFSSFSLDCLKFIQSGQWGKAMVYAIASPACGIFAASLGFQTVKFIP
jgi:fluoride exporter